MGRWEIGDTVKTVNVGWGRDDAVGMITDRQVLAGAAQLGELLEVTFDDGFAFWCGPENLILVERFGGADGGA